MIKVVPLKNNKYLLQSKSGNDIRPKLFQYAVKNDLTVLSMNQKAKSLEDVFLQVTEGLVQ